MKLLLPKRINGFSHGLALLEMFGEIERSEREASKTGSQEPELRTRYRTREGTQLAVLDILSRNAPSKTLSEKRYQKINNVSSLRCVKTTVKQ